MACLVLFAVLAAPALGASVDRPLETLRKVHPRLIAGAADFERVRSLIRSDERARSLYIDLVEEARALAKAPAVEYKIVGPRLLQQSRTALQRIYALALLWQLDRKPEHLARAWRELQSAGNFPDWNPSHFLDTAEMTHAFAIAYDWLYDGLTAEQREWIRQAIIRKGLAPALDVYVRERGWHTVTHNWNQVCNGGIGMGALAIADTDPILATKVLTEALRSIPRAMASYAPDGGWNEGPGYWDYATRYNVYFLAALESALGSDFGLSALPGFDRAGHFRVYFSSPVGQTFNYADASAALNPSAPMYWLARRFGQPVYAWQDHTLREARRRTPRADALALLWFRPESTSPSKAAWPLDALYTGVQTVFFRSSWDDPDAIFLAAKGGDNKANHSHLDLGTFVLDALGVRWAEDLGGDDYNLPAYFGNQRWTYYRLRTESHNTVLIDNENQDPKSQASILSHDFRDPESSIRFDLTAAYPTKLSRFHRTVALRDRRTAVITDEIEAPRPVEALWGMLTSAEVTLDGRKATLRKSDKRLTAEIRQPNGARFEVLSAQPPAPQNQNAGVKKLAVRLPGKITSTRIEVTLTPAR